MALILIGIYSQHRCFSVLAFVNEPGIEITQT